MKKITDLIPSGYTRQTLTKAYLKDFQNSLCTLYKSLQDTYNTNEAFHTNNIMKFIDKFTLNKDVFSVTDLHDYSCNIYGKIDLALYHGKDSQKKPYVIIETKDPKKPQDMITVNDFNKKSMHQLIHYFYREEEDRNNLVKHLIIANGVEWFVFDAQEFKKVTDFYQKIHKQFSEGVYTSKSVDFFYDKVEKADHSFFDDLKKICYYFNLAEYSNLGIEIEEEQEKLITLYRFFSPYTLLKEAHTTDANSLDKKFYEELLYILGLEEKEHSIKESNTDNTLIKLISKANNNLKTLDEKLRYILLIINRVLFLKLLEASLIIMHPEDKSYHFLNKSVIQNFGRLRELFFEVLAKKERENITQEFAKIPYLNSSLFDKQDDEEFLYTISVLDTMKSKDGTKISVLHYLLDFLNSYDFGSYNNIIQEESKPLINSAVLGLVFEKLNGYKEGAFFTPEAITSYMSDTSIRQSLINLFSQKLKREIKDWEALREITREDKSLEDIFNKIRICDPAVGSGHFIVSVLNKLIALKHDLGLLCYADKTKIAQQDYVIEVENDELLILDERNKLFKYQVFNGIINKEVQKLQEALFEEKKYLIENCLFGVDINPKSVMICQLRLWIELLKHTYYHVDESFKPLHLETLPNIDINIKEGNSLVHRFDIRDKMNLSPKEIAFLKEYHRLTTAYKEEARGKEKDEYRRALEILKCDIQKENMEKQIKEIDVQIIAGNNSISFITSSFTEISKNSQKEIVKLEKQVVLLEKQKLPLEKYLNDINRNLDNLQREIIKKAKFDDDKFAHSMEWRYEFPEVLDLETGKFVGFDLIIMNPPYVALQELSQKDDLDQHSFDTYAPTGDIYQLFLERAFKLIHDKGIVSAIVSNKWMRAGYGEGTRGWLYQNAFVHEVLDLGSGWFDSATVDTNIITYEKRDSRPIQGTISAYSLNNKIESIQKGKDSSPHKMIIPNHGESWIILSEIESQILEKMKKVGKPLKDWDISINYGIKTGFNEAFIIDGATKDQLIKDDSRSAEIIKPLLHDNSILKYGINFNNMYLLNVHNGVKGKNIEPININNYPAIKKYLDYIASQVEQGSIKRRGGHTGNNKSFFVRSDTGITPYNLRSCAYLLNFDKPKIIWKQTSKLKTFTYDDKGYFLDVSGQMLISDKVNLFMLLGFLNSTLVEYYIKNISASFSGIGIRWIPQYIESVPIPVPTPEQEKQITDLVKTILTKKASNTNQDNTLNNTSPEEGQASSTINDTSPEERQIDEIVYALYGLSEGEIGIVEG